MQVYLEVNDEPVDIHMKLDEQGAAFFVEGYDADEAEAIELATHPELATSPIPGILFMQFTSTLGGEI